MTEVLMDVADIRFTQEHVFDSFNANDERAGGVAELIDAILAGTKGVRDMPLIRVAAKHRAYWCVDNRRLFVYKHCQLGEIPVIVMDWKDMREFALKWKNGLATRAVTSEGRRVGVIQRTDMPFPRSAVMEPSLSSIRLHLAPEAQLRHDALIAALRRRRVEAEIDDTDAASVAQVETAALRCLLAQGVAEGGPGPGKRKKRRPAAEVAASACEAVEQTSSVAAPRKKQKRGAAVGRQGRAAPATTSLSATGGTGRVSLTVALAEDSGDDAYEVEVTAF